MTAPRYQDLLGKNVPARREPGAEIRVFSGSSGGIVAPTKNHVPVTLVEIRLQPGALVHQDLPADYNGFVVILEGAGAIGEERVKVVDGDVAWLTRIEEAAPSDTQITAGEKGMRALLYAGRPLREPVVARGPFVMNTEAQIEQAYADYRAGRFGPT
jgi:redox-sensitive bicupin YhaK (pirin superfamily)